MAQSKRGCRRLGLDQLHLVGVKEEMVTMGPCHRLSGCLLPCPWPRAQCHFWTVTLHLSVSLFGQGWLWVQRSSVS